MDLQSSLFRFSMRTMRLLLLALTFAACRVSRPQPAMPDGATAICETCNATIEAYQVGVSNVWQRKFAGPDRIPREQMSARLTVWREGEPAHAVIVVVGGRVAIAGVAYEVLEITAPSSKVGSVVLRRAQ